MSTLTRTQREAIAGAKFVRSTGWTRRALVGANLRTARALEQQGLVAVEWWPNSNDSRDRDDFLTDDGERLHEQLVGKTPR